MCILRNTSNVKKTQIIFTYKQSVCVRIVEHPRFPGEKNIFFKIFGLRLLVLTREMLNEVPYIIESNPHSFYSFRGLKNQMRIRIACGLDSRS